MARDSRDNYERPIENRPHQSREWDRSHTDVAHNEGRDKRYEVREWTSMNEKSGGKQWEVREREKGSWPQEDNWDRYNDDKWNEQVSHGRGHMEKIVDHNMSGGAGASGGGGGTGGPGPSQTSIARMF